MASPSRVCAFSRTTSSFSRACQVSRSTTGGSGVLSISFAMIISFRVVSNVPSG
jgi:hypothetical protein